MGFVSSILGGSPPPITAAPPPPNPSTGDAAAAIDAKQREERLRRMATGRAATNLTGGVGLTTEPDTAAKKLLGA